MTTQHRAQTGVDVAVSGGSAVEHMEVGRPTIRKGSPTTPPEPVAEHATEDDTPEVAQVLHTCMCALKGAAPAVDHALVVRLQQQEAFKDWLARCPTVSADQVLCHLLIMHCLCACNSTNQIMLEQCIAANLPSRP